MLLELMDVVVFFALCAAAVAVESVDYMVSVKSPIFAKKSLWRVAQLICFIRISLARDTQKTLGYGNKWLMVMASQKVVYI